MCQKMRAERRAQRLWDAMSDILRRGVPGRSANRRLNELTRQLNQANKVAWDHDPFACDACLDRWAASAA